MDESLMLIALGFLSAILVALITMPLIWRRAVKVTTRRLGAEAAQAEQAAETIAGLELLVRQKDEEIAALARNNMQLEETIAAATGDAAALHDEIAHLQAESEAARAEAESRGQHLEALRQRLASLESAFSAEMDRQEQVEAQLKALGGKAARLAHELNEAIAALPARHQDIRVSPSATQTPDAEMPVRLAPFPAGDEDLHELHAIKSSLASFGEGAHARGDSSEEDEEDTPARNGAPLPNEKFLAERIRALEAGVAS